MKKFLRSIIPETSRIRLAYHRAKALLAALLYGFPAKKLTVIGITGTDGKTTTVGMIVHILNECGIKAGALSTAFFRIGNEVRWNPTQKTSPSPFLVQKFLRTLVREGCTHAVLECSSHGLLQGRMNHTYPAVAGITNLSQEHLDYHGTIDEYISAKSLLFSMLRGKGTKVLHYSDQSLPLLQAIPSKDTLLYDKEETVIDSRISAPLNLWLEEISVTQEGSAATLVWDDRSASGTERHPLALRIHGAFNLENALCAIGCIRGVPAPPGLGTIIKSLQTFSGVGGRMERIDAGQNFSVYVDFTVTPKSYEATLTTLRSMLPEGRRLLVLTGSCGDRMKEKRPVIGRICTTLADITVVTNEDPYSEDPEAIIDSILTGVSEDVVILKSTESIRENGIASGSGNARVCLRISDRLEAIRLILREAKEGDIVLLCGKGSDTSMMTSVGQVPWNEREIVRDVLQTVNAKAKSRLQWQTTES